VRRKETRLSSTASRANSRLSSPSHLRMQTSVFRARLPPPASTASVRTYAVSVKPPRRYPKKTEPRIYSERKQFLYNQYLRFLETSKECPLIFLQHDKFSITRLTKLRKDIAAATSRKGGFAPSLLNPGPTPLTPSNDPSITTPPSLTVIRTSIFGAALRNYAAIDAKTAKDISNTVENGLAILSLPSLDPPTLNAILNALQKSAPPSKPGEEKKASSSKKPSTDDPDFVPGRRVKRVKPTRTPELTVMGALIDGKVFRAPAVHDVATLPTLDTLRAQLIGLISSPANQIAGILGQASGGQIARTLEGFKKGLEDAEGNANSTP
jgi:ribosomal protein L10